MFCMPRHSPHARSCMRNALNTYSRRHLFDVGFCGSCLFYSYLERSQRTCTGSRRDMYVPQMHRHGCHHYLRDTIVTRLAHRRLHHQPMSLYLLLVLFTGTRVDVRNGITIIISAPWLSRTPTNAALSCPRHTQASTIHSGIHGPCHQI